MLTSIIIDRVENINVFNIVQDSEISNPILKHSERLQSTVDRDLIDEYLDELMRIANISRSLSSLPRGNEEHQALIFQHLNLSLKLKMIGEALFKQFFPPVLQEFIRESQQGYLYFHIDSELSSLPIEILHDGQSFLWEKFYVGKAIKGQENSKSDLRAKEVLSMLIIADPREDLDWARREGEMLFEYLGSHVPQKKLNLEMIGGKSITKLSLLNAILDKDIIHYAGHLHYSGTPEENGWVLADSKILYAREFKMSGANPALIFCNSCLSGRSDESEKSRNNWYTEYASAFIKTGRTSYIGTNWDVPDRQPTLEFTTHFYDNLFQSKTIGEALQHSRRHARDHFSFNDLTWASYLLMGNPQHLIFQDNSRLPDVTQNILDAEEVIEYYPFPIAKAFEAFHKAQIDSPMDSSKILSTLFILVENTIFFLAAVILANYKLFNFTKSIPFEYPDIEKVFTSLFQALSNIKALKAHPLAVNLLETFYIHKDGLLKLIELRKRYINNKLTASELETYVVTIQYLIESIMIDFDFLRNYGYYLVVEPGHRQLSFQGVSRFHTHRDILLPTQANTLTYSELIEKTSLLVGKFVFYSPVKKIFLDLSPYIDISMEDGSYELNFKSDIC